MATFSNAANWDPEVTSARALLLGEPKLGSEYELIIKMRNRTIPFIFSIVEFDAPFRVVLESVTKTFYSRNVITVRPVGKNVSELTYFATLRYRGFAALFNLLLAVPFHRRGNIGRVSLATALSHL